MMSTLTASLEHWLMMMTKKVIIVGRNTSEEEIVERLIIEKTDNITVCNVDGQRTIENKLWIEYILDKINRIE